MYFYELHETDDDLFTDLLLAHDVEFAEDEFLEIVLEARDAVVATFEEDTLIEGIGRELARVHGFTVIDDSQIRVAVNVSVHDGETVVAELDQRAAARGRDADDEDGDDEAYRSILIEVDPEDSR